MARLFGQANGRYKPAIERFAEKCRFDPTTGCVLWEGGTSAGRGNTAVYGRFCDENGRMQYAHRWAARHIHGIDTDGLQVGHCCPHGPNTLCVQHVAAQTQRENLEEQMARGSGVCGVQRPNERQYWLFVQLGIEPAPAVQELPPDLVPFHEPPAWLRPFLKQVDNDDDCPF